MMDTKWWQKLTLPVAKWAKKGGSMTYMYDVGNLGPGFGHAQKCGGVKNIWSAEKQ